LKRNLGLLGVGGGVGYVLVDKFFVVFLGRVGTFILFMVLYVVGLIVVINLRPSQWFLLLTSRAGDAYRDWQQVKGGGNVRRPQQKDLADRAKNGDAAQRDAVVKEHFSKLPPPEIKDTNVQPLKPARPAPAGTGEPVPRQATPVANGAAAKDAPLPKVPEPKILDVSSPPPAAKPPLPKPPPKKKVEKPPELISAAGFADYRLPSPELLNVPPKDRPTVSKEDLMRNAEVLCSTLSDFDIPVQMGDVTRGPTITRYEVHPAPGVKIERIISLQTNIAAAMKAGNVNIIAPVPGKGTVGIEVPNSAKMTVYAREMFESEAWHKAKGRVPLALGRDVYGEPVIADLSEMPHLLIAGSTGSGKSVCINSLVTSMLFRHSPADLRFVMIDPKVVELQVYSTLPHLAVPVVTDPKKVIFALRWAINEMERRYQCFAKVGVRNVWAFNDRPKKPLVPAEPELPLDDAPSNGGAKAEAPITVPRDDELRIPEKFPYIVLIIDELADLMLVAPADVEMAIARITQMGRAAGIHMIVATQRPSVDVITGVIKSNISARIAFQVAAQVDSRTILDGKGAEKLLGKGDMLYLPPGTSKLIRAQGVLVVDEELKRTVDFCAAQAKPQFAVDIVDRMAKEAAAEEEETSEEDEELIEKSIEVIRQTKRASVSMLQRRLRIGYTRAARIMDVLEERGIVGPGSGSEPREILVDLDAGVPSNGDDES
jgi:S-DNA-T family DNA segregation ATPase FtsK/SpoIIIE